MSGHVGARVVDEAITDFASMTKLNRRAVPSDIKSVYLLVSSRV
jgi:hypothetical protein